jgi:hypothetical protein
MEGCACNCFPQLVLRGGHIPAYALHSAVLQLHRRKDSIKSTAAEQWQQDNAKGLINEYFSCSLPLVPRLNILFHFLIISRCCSWPSFLHCASLFKVQSWHETLTHVELCLWMQSFGPLLPLVMKILLKFKDEVPAASDLAYCIV